MGTHSHLFKIHELTESRYRFYASAGPEPADPSTTLVESANKPIGSTTPKTNFFSPEPSVLQRLEGAENREWYWKNREQIRKQYEGQKIAIECCRIIASAGAEFVLYDELHKSMYLIPYVPTLL